jgi:SH3-like domain-containing protein
MLFGIGVPVNMIDLYQHWSKLGTKKYKSLLLTAAAALLWAIWITRNEVVFEKCRQKYCRYYLEKLTGYVSGQACSGTMISKIN